MASYTLKRNCKVYLYDAVSGYKYQLEIYPDLSFSQTFDETAIDVKTLHDQTAMFESAVITKANPANFNFTVLLNNLIAHKTVLDFLVKTNVASVNSSVEALSSGDLYIDTGVDIFKLEKSVFEHGTFQFSKDSLVTVQLSGTAIKLTRFGATGTAIPGTLAATTTTVPAIIPSATAVTLDGVDQPNIAGITLELSNSVEWLNYDTLHKSLAITGPTDTMYPEAFVVTNKALTGSITQYLTDANNSRVNSWSTNSTLRIRVGTSTGPTYYLDVNIPSAVFTNRLQPDESFMQIYDYRMVSNPADLTTVINYVF